MRGTASSGCGESRRWMAENDFRDRLQRTNGKLCNSRSHKWIDRRCWSLLASYRERTWRIDLVQDLSGVIFAVQSRQRILGELAKPNWSGGLPTSYRRTALCDPFFFFLSRFCRTKSKSRGKDLTCLRTPRHLSQFSLGLAVSTHQMLFLL